MTAVRFRITYARGEASAHLDQQQTARAWEAALKASGLPIEVVGPGRPRLAVAAPLPAGYTSEADIVEVHFSSPLEAGDLARELSKHVPESFAIRHVAETSPAERPVQAEVLWSEYEVELRDRTSRPDLERSIEELMSRSEVILEETRRGRARRVDLRAGIAEVVLLEESEGPTTLLMRLRAGPAPNVRPEQVLQALGLGQAASVRRTRLVLGGLTPAQLAWRSTGRFQER